MLQDHLLPAQYVKLMQQNALNACPTTPYADVVRTFKEEIGRSPHHLFRVFEEEPLASASLAQVHRAETYDGEAVAVKVQHRTLRDSASADIATIRCALLRYTLTGPAIA
jgi:aarF domain-containing kinase